MLLLVVSVEAAETTALSVSNAACIVGDEVSVSVNISDYSLACGGSFNIVYDNTKLSLKNVAKGTAFKNINATINKSYSNNSVRVVWIGTKTPAGGAIIDLTFTSLSSGTTTVSLDNVKLADVDANKLECQEKNGSITILSEQNTIVITEATYDYVKIHSAENKNIDVIIASYNNDRLCSSDIIHTTLNAGNNTVNIPEHINKNNTIKVFCFASISSLKPLCSAKTVE